MKMSFVDLYMNKNPLITASSEDTEPVATVFGVPFDATHSYRPGCRFGPDAIRSSFNNIEVFHPKFQVDLQAVHIEDLGNTRHTVVASLIILGGEHSITYGAYTSFPKETGYVVFDAHYDLRDEFADSKLSHASYLRRIIEERGAENILHVGARGFVSEELEFLKENNIKTISDKEIREGKGPQLLKDHVSTFDTIYSSFDLDVLDPAFAPGVGNPEAVGISARELFDMIHSFEETKITGVDIVELNPYHDNGSTASIAAKIMSTMIAINFSQNQL